MTNPMANVLVGERWASVEYGTANQGEVQWDLVGTEGATVATKAWHERQTGWHVY